MYAQAIRRSNRSLTFRIVLFFWTLIHRLVSHPKTPQFAGVLFIVYVWSALVFGVCGNPHYMNPLHWFGH